MKFRIDVFRNGKNNRCCSISYNENIDDFISDVSQRWEIPKTDVRIFTKNGIEIKASDPFEFYKDLLNEDDPLYASRGEDFLDPYDGLPREWIHLNIGGKHFITSKNNIVKNEPQSMLARMFTEENNQFSLQPSYRDSDGGYLIDRSPLYFEPILNYLRHGQVILDKGVNPAGVLEEARFYGIESMIPQLEMLLQNETEKDNAPLTRQEVIRALIKTSCNEELRFQGVNMSGADLNHLDLRHINFKYANLSRCDLTGANLSYCCLERADLSHAILKSSQLYRVKALCANLEGANLQNCNLDDPSGAHSVMEGVNLKGANMEGSNMGRVNLRVATLKNANLQNCDLKKTDFAGANLENCNLSGSDLQNANLRGANLKEAVFDQMLTPLHMSQTVR